MSSHPPSRHQSPQSIFTSVLSPGLKAELKSLYDELAAKQAMLNIPCHQCGACCHFDTYGHELWVTTLELAYLFDTEGKRLPVAKGKCPYMVENRCTARTGRTLGCRIYLCEQHPTEMEALHEIYFERIREIAAKHSIELEYNEFLAALASTQFNGDDAPPVKK